MQNQPLYLMWAQKSKCGSIRSQPLLGPSKCVVLSALCMSLCVFFSLYFYLNVFIIHIFPALGIFLDGSHWVMGCSPPGKFYYRLHRNVITLLPLSHEWNKRIFYLLFFLACLNSLEPCLSDNKATSDQAALTFCQPGRIVKAAGKFCSDIREAFKGFILAQGWLLHQNSTYDINQGSTFSENLLEKPTMQAEMWSS